MSKGTFVDILIIDHLPIFICIVFNSLDDVKFVKAVLGDCSFFDDNMNSLNLDLCYIFQIHILMLTKFDFWSSGTGLR